MVHFSYKNINSSYSYSEKLIYLMVFNFFCGCMCTHCLVRGFATGSGVGALTIVGPKNRVQKVEGICTEKLGALF